MTNEQLAEIEAQVKSGLTGSKWQTKVTVLTEDIPNLVAEVRRLKMLLAFNEAVDAEVDDIEIITALNLNVDWREAEKEIIRLNESEKLDGLALIRAAQPAEAR